MTFKELLNKYDDSDILKRLFKRYPNQRKNKAGYEKALLEIRRARVRKSDFIIKLAVVEDDGERWVDVSGNKAGEDVSYAIEYEPWGKWKASSIDPDSLREFEEIDVLAHCVWEMTWAGYSQRSVKRQIDSIMKIKEDFDKHPEKVEKCEPI